MADAKKPPLQGLNTPVGVWEMVPSPSCAADVRLARHVRRPLLRSTVSPARPCMLGPAGRRIGRTGVNDIVAPGGVVKSDWRIP